VANRIVSDITYKSRKVRQIQPPELRPEYVWIIPLFNGHGVCEFDAESIWADAYALNRPGWDSDKVKQMLDELVRVELLATWEEDGHTWAWLVGSDKPGLLPKPSERNVRERRPPAALLQRHSSGDSAAQPPIGIGTGSGFGTGSGTGNDAVAETETGHNSHTGEEEEPREENEDLVRWWASTLSTAYKGKDLTPALMPKAQASCFKYLASAGPSGRKKILKAFAASLEGEVFMEPDDNVELSKESTSKAFEIED
jgi:hypothetical protein